MALGVREAGLPSVGTRMFAEPTLRTAAAKRAADFPAGGGTMLRNAVLEDQEMTEGITDGRYSAGQDREDRIRMVFGLRRRIVRLPAVDMGTLQEYFHYLATHLALPFYARYYDDAGPAAETTRLLAIVGLPHPSQYTLDLSKGLLCTARNEFDEFRLPLADMRVSEDHANHGLIEDYWYWLWNWG